MKVTREEAIEKLVEIDSQMEEKPLSGNRRGETVRKIYSNAENDFLALMVENLLDLESDSVEIIPQLESKIREYEKNE